MLSASVTVDKQLVSSIGKGVLVFAAIAPGDTEKEVEALASKVLKMRMVRIIPSSSLKFLPSPRMNAVSPSWHPRTLQCN